MRVKAGSPWYGEITPHHYSRNKVEIDKRSRAWALANPERMRLIHRTHDCNRHYPGRITVSEVAKIIEDSKGLCYWCGVKCEGRGKLRLTLDHLLPFNDPDCIVVACNTHNASRRFASRHRLPWIPMTQALIVAQ